MPKPLIYHTVEFQPADPSETLRDSIGGHPYLPKDMDYPVCSCGKPMNLYLQFDIREEFGLPFETGSHLAIFMCEACNQNPDRLYSYFYIDEKTAKTQDQLRESYWDFNGSEWEGEWTKFYRLMLLKPGGEFEFFPADEFINSCSLKFQRAEEAWTPDPNAPDWVPEKEEIDFESEPGFPGTSANLSAMQYSSEVFKIGGQPAWGGDEEPPNNLLCCCGAPMALICFVPCQLVFPNDRTDEYDYNHVGSLFTGLYTFILACRAQCHPFAVYPVAQPF